MVRYRAVDLVRIHRCPDVRTNVGRALLSAACACVLAACSGTGGSAPVSSGPIAGNGAIRSAAAASTETVWIADSDGTLGTGGVTAYAISPTAATLTAVPANAINESRPNINSQPAGIYGPQALAFDAAGRLWIGNQLSALIVAATLHGPGVAPTIDLASGVGFAGLNPVALGFDKTGNLWTYSAGLGTFNQFIGYAAFAINPTTLKATRLTTVVPNPPQGAVGGVFFDSSGTLWAITANSFQAYSVSGGTATPTKSIATDCDTNPAFDPSGNLWCAAQASVSGSAITIQGYSPAGGQIASFNVPSPPPSINVQAFYAVDDVHFDPAGNLWALVTGAAPTGIPGSGTPDYAGLIAFNVTTGAPTTMVALPNSDDFYLDFAFAP